MMVYFEYFSEHSITFCSICKGGKVREHALYLVTVVPHTFSYGFSIVDKYESEVGLESKKHVKLPFSIRA